MTDILTRAEDALTGIAEGPWEKGCRYTDTGVWSGTEQIAATHSAQRNYDRDEQIAKQDANARFIAAAPDLVRDLMAEVKRSREALKEAGDVIEAYHKTTGIDLGDASRMPFYADTMKKIDAALEGDKP